jgi:hypothetical protein
MDSQVYIKKRPCGICRRWFRPHPRLKDRQKTCNSPACKKEWHRKKCAEWNRANSDYFKTNYLQKKLEPEKQATQVKSRLKTGLPLEHVQEVIGMKHLVIIEYLAQLLLRRFQELIWMQTSVNTGQIDRLPREAFSRCDRQ